ncbi:hypothetical protein [Wenxinia marina]|uniref:hypothetical protein n=1 Tax=Wenxinia marina TaxID=390641 RepID=UPI0019B6615D|nr:hypothetical protein [Wenxinia marina]GGL50181.1 hypothetical protein GCM10011392_00570 [Wenxinia marina]
MEVGFALTVEDRVGIERLLRHNRTKHSPNPPLLNGLLRHKLKISRGALEPAADDLVISGRIVTYRIDREGDRFGTLTMSPLPIPANILVASLLGATMIGMRKLQKVPLLRDDGEIVTLTILDVEEPPASTVA